MSVLFGFNQAGALVDSPVSGGGLRAPSMGRGTTFQYASPVPEPGDPDFIGPLQPPEKSTEAVAGSGWSDVWKSLAATAGNILITRELAKSGSVGNRSTATGSKGELASAPETFTDFWGNVVYGNRYRAPAGAANESSFNPMFLVLGIGVLAVAAVALRRR